MSGDLLLLAATLFVVACGFALADRQDAGRMCFRAATFVALAAFLLAALRMVTA